MLLSIYRAALLLGLPVVGIFLMYALITKPVDVKTGACFLLNDVMMYAEVTGHGLDESGTVVYVLDTSFRYRQYRDYTATSLKEHASPADCDSTYLHMALQDKDIEIRDLQNKIDLLDSRVENVAREVMGGV